MNVSHSIEMQGLTYHLFFLSLREGYECQSLYRDVGVNLSFVLFIAGMHTIFGRVCQGMSVVNMMGMVGTDSSDRYIGRHQGPLALTSLLIVMSFCLCCRPTEEISIFRAYTKD